MSTETKNTDTLLVGDRTVSPRTADSKLKFGASDSAGVKKRQDVEFYGSTYESKDVLDASANLRTITNISQRLEGPSRLVGFNRLSSRFELKWVGGQRGKPGINGDILSATEATREIADPDFEILGTNGVSACTAINAEGGITLTTTTGSGDQVILVPHLDTAQSAWGTVTWGTDRSVEWECDISTAASIADIVIWAGLKLTNTSVTATDAEQAFFRFAPATNSGKFQAVYSIAGTDTESDSGVTVAASTRYHLKIIISSARIATFYVDGVLVLTSTALTAGDLIPYVGVQTSTTAAKGIVAHGQAISRLIGA